MRLEEESSDSAADEDEVLRISLTRGRVRGVCHGKFTKHCGRTRTTKARRKCWKELRATGQRNLFFIHFNDMLHQTLNRLRLLQTAKHRLQSQPKKLRKPPMMISVMHFPFRYKVSSGLRAYQPHIPEQSGTARRWIGVLVLDLVKENTGLSKQTSLAIFW